MRSGRVALGALALAGSLAGGAAAQDDGSNSDAPSQAPTMPEDHSGEWRQVEDLMANSFGVFPVSGATGATFGMRSGSQVYLCFAGAIGLPLDAGGLLPHTPPVPRIRCVLTE